jgi:hypothetical protein
MIRMLIAGSVNSPPTLLGLLSPFLFPSLISTAFTEEF